MPLGVLVALTAALVAVELAMGGDGHHPSGFSAAVGVVGGVVLVVVAKFLGKRWLQRPERDDE